MKCGYIRCLENKEKQSIVKKLLREFNRVELVDIFEENYYINVDLKPEKISKFKKRQIINLYKKIYNLLYNNKIFNIVLDGNLFDNELLRNLLYSTNINIINGKKLSNILTYEVIEYISKNAKCNLSDLEVSLLVNEYNFINEYNIKKISQNVKVLNIVSDNVERFTKLSSKIYEENGSYIQVTNNLKESLKRSNIIINIDFEKQKLAKCIFPKDCIIINLNKEFCENKKGFNGILVNGIEINIPEAYMTDYLKSIKTTNLIISESILYNKLDNIDEIINKFKTKKFKINYLLGSRGKLANEEFQRVKKYWKVNKRKILDKQTKLN